MTADRIQGWSRSLIFLGLIFIGTVVASVFATTVANLFFGGAVTILPGEGMPVGLTPEASYGLEETTLPETFMLVLMSDGVLETIEAVDLIEREKTLLTRLGGTLEKPGDLIRRLDLGEVTSDDLADDIAGLFVSRGVG